jgi:alpha-tubulin suppressor-like RCC1 family protein
MDVTNLVLNLKSKISDTSIDQQMLSKAIQLLQLGAINSVSSFSDLPNAATARKDELYLVEYDGIYKNNGTGWTPFVQNFSTALAWGNNAAGHLGDNSLVNKCSPVFVVGGFADWRQLSAGRSHSLGVRCNGTAWAWGSSVGGILGDNTLIAKSSPASVVGGFTDWCQVSAGERSSLAVRQNGTAWAWGYNTCGLLGDGTTVGKSSPVSVVGGFTDWCQLSAGFRHSLGVRQNGTAWAWGSNLSGRLGDNTTVSRSSPVSVVGGFTNWCQVSAGCEHSLGVRQNGSAWAWGEGNDGRLGDNNTTDRSSPVSVVGGFTDWCQISAGSSHSLGVRQNGSAWAWGDNTCGQLGDNTILSKRSPVSVIGGFTDWCQVSAGYRHSLAVRQNGTAWAWGYNGIGPLGDNTSISRSSPVSVVGGFTDWYDVSAGWCHSLAIRKTQL